jgi:MFS family permease
MSRDLFIVAIALFAWGMGESAYRFFQPLYLEQLGATPMAIGTILGGLGIAMTIAHIPAGFLADRLGRRIMMWAAWFLGVLSGIIMATARSLSVFTIGVLLYGITAAVVAPLNSYITAARGKWSVGRAITITSAAYNLGAIIGPFLGGIIGDRFGYANIYLFATIVFIISTGFILNIKPQAPVKRQTDTASQRFLKPPFLIFMMILFLATMGMFISQPLAPNFLQNSHGLSLSQIGTLGAISSIGSVVISLVVGNFNAGFGFIIGQLGTGLFSLFLWLGTGFPWFVIGFFMLGGFRAARAMSVAQLGGLISVANMGLAYGIAETISGLATIIAPLLAGYLYGINPELIFQTGIVIIVISMIFTLVFTLKVKDVTIGGN